MNIKIAETKEDKIIDYIIEQILNAPMDKEVER